MIRPLLLAAFLLAVTRPASANPWGGPGDLGRRTPECPSKALETPEAGDRFGQALALGDFDGDGVDDLAVGAPGEGGTSAFTAQSGAVLLFRGFKVPNPVVKHQDHDFMPWRTLRRHDLGHLPMRADDALGHALVSADFNGDGFDDLAMGAPGADSVLGEATGRVFVGWGSPSGLGEFDDLSPSSAGLLPTGYDRFGWALAAGDVNDDGLMDLAIGAPGTSHGDGEAAGHAHVMVGTPFGLEAWSGVFQETPRTALSPAQDDDGSPLGTSQAFDEFGGSLALGDLDNDGRADLVVGAPGDLAGDTRAGAVYVFQSAEDGLRGWSRIDQTGAPDGTAENEFFDGFGFSVAIGNFKTSNWYENEIVVGVPFEDLEEFSSVGYADAGVVDMFENVMGHIQWHSRKHQSPASDNRAGDMFGWALVSYRSSAGWPKLLASAPGDNRHDLDDVGEALFFQATSQGLTDGGASLSEDTYVFGYGAHAQLGLAAAVSKQTSAIWHDFDGSLSGGVLIGGRDGHLLLQNTIRRPPNCPRRPTGPGAITW